MDLGTRILMFFEFCFNQGWEGGIAYHEKQFFVTITNDGNIYAIGQNDRLGLALDECVEALKKAGF